MRKGLLVLVALFTLVGTANASFFSDPSNVWGTWKGNVVIPFMYSGDATFILGSEEKLSLSEPYYLYVPGSFAGMGDDPNWPLSEPGFSYITGSASSSEENVLRYAAMYTALSSFLGNILVETVSTFTYGANNKPLLMDLTGSTVTLFAGTASAQTYNITGQLSPTPIPGALWLLGTGIFGLFGLRRKLAA